MDQTELLTVAIGNAARQKQSVRVCGQGSKRHLLPEVGGEMVSTVEHTGIVAHEPEELVVTVRAGTSLKELKRVLARERQILASDPPEFSGLGSIGGAVATGLSGPARPWRGSIRDTLLGVDLINGRGEHLKFGGQVMKNVAGYDVSRLCAGAFSSLGLILSVSLRLQPKPDYECTLRYELDAHDAINFMRKIAQKPHPLTGTFWHAGQLCLRLEGTENAIEAAKTRLGGELAPATDFWESVRDHRHPAFSKLGAGEIVRIVCPPNAPAPADSECIMEWGGGLRWLAAGGDIDAYVASVGGWAWHIGRGFSIEAGQKMIMARLRDAFDPEGIFCSPMNLEVEDAD